MEPIGKLVVTQQLLVPDRTTWISVFHEHSLNLPTPLRSLASPIEPSWIIESTPLAEASVLSKCADSQAWTVVWQCSEGRFNWHYDYDETILILDGSIVLENETFTRPATDGDVIFFKDGAQAKWHVQSNVRKLGFCRKTQPVLLSDVLQALSKIKRFSCGPQIVFPRLGSP